MNPLDDPWLGLLLLGLFCLMMFLRLTFPNASRRSETITLLAATVLFFAFCGLLANPQEPTMQTADEIRQVRVSR
jgi:hypothetical protein